MTTLVTRNASRPEPALSEVEGPDAGRTKYTPGARRDASFGPGASTITVASVPSAGARLAGGAPARPRASWFAVACYLSAVLLFTWLLAEFGFHPLSVTGAALAFACSSAMWSSVGRWSPYAALLPLALGVVLLTVRGINRGALRVWPAGVLLILLGAESLAAFPLVAAWPWATRAAAPVHHLPRRRTLWYRFHQLFRDLLCKRALQNYPSEIENWHRLASLWFEKHGMLDKAIEHALAAEDDEHAFDLIEMSAQSTISRSEFYTFQGWVSQLPEEKVSDRPILVLLYAWALIVTNTPNEEVEAWLKKVDTSSEGTASKASVLRGYLDFLQGEFFRPMPLLQQSLDKLPPEDSLFRGIATWLLSFYSIATGDFNTGSQALEILVQTSLQKNHIIIDAGALCALAEVHIRMGQLRQAKDDYEHALAVARDSRGRLPVAARALMGLGELWREWNDLELATRYCLEGS